MKTLEQAEKPPVRFPLKESRDFGTVVRKRVDTFFKENKLSRHATPVLHLKIFLHIIMLAVLYAAILTQPVGVFGLIALVILLGVTQGLIGVNVCHDALHGAYSANSTINSFLGHMFDLVGPSSMIWKVTHNFHHHIYTNIPGLDHDINKSFVLCLSPADKQYWFHKYQHIYAFILYCFTTLNWILYSDYLYFFKEQKKKSWPLRKSLLFLLLKGLNLTVFLFIPMAIMTLPWWQIITGFVLFQCAGGFTVAIIFQMAHLVEGVEFPEPNPQGLMENQWADHEMRTTVNFATDNLWLTHLVGGLNFQIEHHLFPYISHVHYPVIAPIVRQTAKEFHLPYYENKSFFQAICSHIRMLKKLGAPRSGKIGPSSFFTNTP